MKADGYTAQIEYRDEDGLLIGHNAGIKDIVGFHGESVDTLQEAFAEVFADTWRRSPSEGAPHGWNKKKDAAPQRTNQTLNRYAETWQCWPKRNAHDLNDRRKKTAFAGAVLL